MSAAEYADGVFCCGYGLVGVFVFHDDDVGDVVWRARLSHGCVTMRSGWLWCCVSRSRSRISPWRSLRASCSRLRSLQIALQRFDVVLPSHFALNPGMGTMRGVMFSVLWLAK